MRWTLRFDREAFWKAAAIAFFCLAPMSAAAQAAASNESRSGSVPPATLTFENREIFVFRSVVEGFAPVERAQGAHARLDVASRRGADERVTTQQIMQGTVVKVGPAAIFTVVPGDVDTPAGDTLESTVERAVAALQVALAESHERHDLRRLALAGAASMAATLVFGALLMLLVRIVRWSAGRLALQGRALAEQLKVGEHRALNPVAVANVLRRLTQLIGWACALVLLYLWLAFVLERFPYTRPWGERLQSFFLDMLATVALAIAGAIPRLILVVVIVLIARALVRAVGRFLRRVEDGNVRLGWLDADTAVPTRRIITVTLWLFALAMAYPYLPGADSEAFKGLSVLAGVMISIGASGIVSQAMSGLMLTYSRAVRVGEYVRIAETEGTIIELGTFATRIRTGLGEEVILPNALVVSSSLKNYSRVVGGQGFVLDATVTIGYSTPWRQVHAMLLEAARRTPDILSEPQPFVVQTALADFYVAYRLVAYAGAEAPQRRALVLDALLANIQDVFNEHGVQIMSPHYMIDPEQAQIVPKEKWYAAPAHKPGSETS
jgi:small-conductance mechanosensitive channel